MTRQEFAAQVETLIATLDAIKQHSMSGFPKVDYAIESCECAAAITGYDATFCKMFNRQFREDALDVMFERAVARAA